MPTPKKSEMLKFRLSHADKQALAAKARGEDRSVSDVMRGLISGYIAGSDNTPAPSPTFASALMSIFKRYPTFTLGGVAVLCAAPLLLVTPANAEDVSLRFEGEYVMPVVEDGETGLNTRSFINEVTLDLDTPATFPAMGPHGSVFVTLTVTSVENGVSIRMEFTENKTVIASPTLQAAFGETASFLTEGRDGTRFSLNISPEAQ